MIHKTKQWKKITLYLYSLIDCPSRYITKIFTDNTSFTIFNCLCKKLLWTYYCPFECIAWRYLSVCGYSHSRTNSALYFINFFFLQTFSFLLIKQLVQGNSRNYTTLHGWHPYGELSRTISLSLNDPDMFRLDQLE